MKISYLPSFQAESALKEIGENLRVARLRRAESETLASERIGISRSTYQRLERGDANVSAGALLDALIIYGFADQVFTIGAPDLDEAGKRLDRLRLPKRGKN